MANLEAGHVYRRIAEVVAEHVDGDPVGSFFYAKAADAWASGSVYQDRGNLIVYHELDHNLSDLIVEAWEAEDADKRWAEMHFRLLDGRFNAKLIYPEEIDAAEDPLDRRDRIVREIFGDKPIDYGEGAIPD